MRPIHRVSLFAPFAAALVLALPERAARADDSGSGPRPLDTREDAVWDHVEMSMGFLAGQRAYGSTTFNASSSGAPAGAASLVEPFQRAPFDRVDVYGLRYDVRLVVSYVRMTAGFDLPFASFSLGDGDAHYSVDGADHAVSVRSLGTKDLRFGIGGEYPFGPLAPFVDLLGAVHWVSTTLTIDGAPADYSAAGFAFAVRAGLRLHVRKWFYATAAGELGLVGDERWGCELGVGFAFM